AGAGYAVGVPHSCLLPLAPCLGEGEMSVRLTPEEVEEFLTEGHELIFTTIGTDGYPLPIPVWYLYLDGAIYVRSIASLQKVVNARRNPKVAGVVSSGDAWVDLKAVIFRGEAEEVTD